MRDRVVEVARVFAVDGDGHQGRKSVRSRRSFSFTSLPMRARFFDRLVAVLIGHAVFPDDDFVVDAWLVDVAEHFGDPAERTASGGRPAGDLDDHHVAGVRVQRSSDGIWTSMMSRRSNGTTKPMPDAVQVEPPDDRLGAALEDRARCDPRRGCLLTRSMRATTRSPCIA